MDLVCNMPFPSVTQAKKGHFLSDKRSSDKRRRVETFISRRSDKRRVETFISRHARSIQTDCACVIQFNSCS